MEILNNIPFELDTQALLSRLHVNESDGMAREILKLAEEVLPVIAPKAVYEVCYVEDKGYDTVTLGGITFTSRVLCVNLDEVQRVFAYIATCGNEIDVLGLADGDFVVSFWLDTIKEMALGASAGHLRSHLKEKYLLGQMSNMNPGAGDRDTWPIEQQKELFSIFGNVEELIGVQLTDTCLMLPNKTVSGIFFPTEIPFESCQVCQREDCPGRRAPYNPHFLETRCGNSVETP